MTNLLSRPLPSSPGRHGTVNDLSGRFVLGVWCGRMWEEIVALGVPRLSPGDRVRALEEAIMVVRDLSGGGRSGHVDGEFYQVTGLNARGRSNPPIWIGALARRPWQ